MKYPAGLDVSLEETSICVVDENGRIERETRAASEPEALEKTWRATRRPATNRSKPTMLESRPDRSRPRTYRRSVLRGARAQT